MKGSFCVSMRDVCVVVLMMCVRAWGGGGSVTVI